MKKRLALAVALAATTSIVGCALFGGPPAASPGTSGGGSAAEETRDYSGVVFVPKAALGESSAYRTQFPIDFTGMPYQDPVQPARGTVTVVPLVVSGVITAARNLSAGLAFLEFLPSIATTVTPEVARLLQGELFKRYDELETAIWLSWMSDDLFDKAEAPNNDILWTWIYLADPKAWFVKVNDEIGNPGLDASKRARAKLDELISSATLAKAQFDSGPGRFTARVRQKTNHSIGSAAYSVQEQSGGAELPKAERPPEFGPAPDMASRKKLSDQEAKAAFGARNVVAIADGFARNDAASYRIQSADDLLKRFTGPESLSLVSFLEPNEEVAVSPGTTALLAALPIDKLKDLPPSAFWEVASKIDLKLDAAEAVAALKGLGAAKASLASVARRYPELVEKVNQILTSYVPPTPTPAPTPTPTPIPTPTPSPTATPDQRTLGAFVSAGSTPIRSPRPPRSRWATRSTSWAALSARGTSRSPRPTASSRPPSTAPATWAPSRNPAAT